MVDRMRGLGWKGKGWVLVASRAIPFGWREGGTDPIVNRESRACRGLLPEVRPEHDRQPHRLPPIARLRIVRSHQRFQPRPRNHLLHLIQEKLPSALPSILLEHSLAR
jgi:hypothetical protein